MNKIIFRAAFQAGAGTGRRTNESTDHGAGPAGLSCGYELTKAGIEVEVYEASPFVGGMARSFDLWGQRVDMGPHRFFSKEKHINEFFTTL